MWADAKFQSTKAPKCYYYNSYLCTADGGYQHFLQLKAVSRPLERSQAQLPPALN